MTVENFSRTPDQVPDLEFISQLQEQLKVAWEQLPDTEKASTAVMLLEDLEERERHLFREAFDTKWPITSESVPATFALIKITPDDLAQIGLDEEEITFFDESRLQEMSTEIRDHYVVQGFWEELKYHTTHFLGSFRKPDQK